MNELELAIESGVTAEVESLLAPNFEFASVGDVNRSKPWIHDPTILLECLIRPINEDKAKIIYIDWTSIDQVDNSWDLGGFAIHYHSPGDEISSTWYYPGKHSSLLVRVSEYDDRLMISNMRLFTGFY